MKIETGKKIDDRYLQAILVRSEELGVDVAAHKI